MTVRALTWLELCELAMVRNPPDRIIALAGIPCIVIKSKVEPGLYVRTLDDAPTPWAMRTERELTLLRALVDAGQVTIDDGTPPPGELTPPPGVTIIVNHVGDRAAHPGDLA